MAISIPYVHMCSFRRGKSWYTYQYFEERLSTVSRFLTFSKDNKEAWSEELASLLILAGSAMDTFLRDMKECPYIKNEPSYRVVDERVEKRIKEKSDYPFWTIEDYRDAYNSIYELSTNQITVPYGLDNYGEIQPFEKFHQNGVPIWWTAYNKMKHDYYNSLNKYANLENVINIIGGLLILNVLHKCSQDYLVLFGFIHSEGAINPAKLVTELRRSKIGYPYPSDPVGLLLRPYVNTSHFYYKFKQERII